MSQMVCYVSLFETMVVMFLYNWEEQYLLPAWWRESIYLNSFRWTRRVAREMLHFVALKVSIFLGSFKWIQWAQRLRGSGTTETGGGETSQTEKYKATLKTINMPGFEWSILKDKVRNPH